MATIPDAKVAETGGTFSPSSQAAVTSPRLAIVTQPTDVVSGVDFAPAVAVELLDAAGARVAASTALVMVSVASGTGTIAGTLSVRAVAGVATFGDLRVVGSGSHSLVFVSPGSTAGISSSFTVAADAAGAAAPATQAAITTQPSSSASSGVAFAQQPVVQLADVSNNPVAQAGVVVTAAIATGGGALGGVSTATTDASGAATFTNLAITGTAGPRTLSFTPPGLTAATSDTIVLAVVVDAAAQLSITTQPSATATSGVAFAQQPAIQLRDAANAAVGQSGVVVTASIATGGGALGGTVAATTNSSGVATFTNMSITGADGARTLSFSAPSLTGVTSASVTVSSEVSPPGGGFATPNILNNASFETGWDGFTDWSGGKAPNGVSLDNTHAYDGSSSVLRSWTPNPDGDGGAQFLYRLSGTPLDRVWMRFYFRITAPITTVMKFARFYDTNFSTNLGGFGLAQGSEILTWGTGFENSSIATQIGLQQNQVVDGQWHCLEVDYWRNGDPSGYPSAAFWFDGVQSSIPDETVSSQGATNNAYWLGHRLYAGERANDLGVGYIEMLATLNAGNTTTGQINMDRIAFSTAGRIGP